MIKAFIFKMSLLISFCITSHFISSADDHMQTDSDSDSTMHYGSPQTPPHAIFPAQTTPPMTLKETLKQMASQQLTNDDKTWLDSHCTRAAQGTMEDERIIPAETFNYDD